MYSETEPPENFGFRIADFGIKTLAADARGWTGMNCRAFPPWTPRAETAGGHGVAAHDVAFRQTVPGVELIWKVECVLLEHFEGILDSL